MTTKFQKALIAGIIGSAAMSLVTMIAPMMGLPKMSPPAMLSMMLGVSVVIGWVMHFMIGIIFAMVYSYLMIDPLQRINNIIAKGALFGVVVFVFAEIMLVILGMMFPMPPAEGTMALMMIGSLIGHIVFGIAVVSVVKAPVKVVD